MEKIVKKHEAPLIPGAFNKFGKPILISEGSNFEGLLYQNQLCLHHMDQTSKFGKILNMDWRHEIKRFIRFD